MATDLPDNYDVIILGTGLPETLLAAAFSRIGLSVLHLDRNTYYSGSWASFNLHQIDTWIEDQKKAKCYVSAVDEEKLSTLIQEDERALQLPETFQTVCNPQTKYHVGQHPIEDPLDAEPSLPSATDSSTLTEKSPGTDLPTETKDAPAHGESDLEQTVDLDIVGQIVPGQFDSASEGEEELQTEISHGPETAESRQACQTKVPAASKEKQQKEWFADDIEKDWRKFSFDLAPKLLYCSGSMVELLIVSDVAKYCEFRTVSRILTSHENKLERVPCSRADVFSNKTLSLLEKRLLMKFLSFASEYKTQPKEYEEFLDKPFVDFLASKKMSPKTQYFILHSIAMVTDTTPTLQGLESTKKFLNSLGRYGNTAFLFPLYGSGELPQGFCRLSAVFGGIYVLNLSVSHLVINSENRCNGIITSGGQRIRCKYLIADPSYLLKEYYQVHERSFISRGIFLTESSICPSEEEELSLLQLPHEGQLSSPTTTVLELPSSAMVSPRHLYVVHMTRRAVSDVESDLLPAVSMLFENTLDSESADEAKGVTRKARLLWSLIFQYEDLSSVSRTEHSPANVFVVTGPGVELDVDRCVEEAKIIFKEICPEEEFLPKPPHPDDIIYVDTEEIPATGNEQGDWTPDSSTAHLSETDDTVAGDREAKTQGQSQTDVKDKEKSEVCAASTGNLTEEGVKSEVHQVKSRELVAGDIVEKNDAGDLKVES